MDKETDILTYSTNVLAVRMRGKVWAEMLREGIGKYVPDKILEKFNMFYTDIERYAEEKNFNVEMYPDGSCLMFDYDFFETSLLESGIPGHEWNDWDWKQIVDFVSQHGGRLYTKSFGWHEPLIYSPEEPEDYHEPLKI